MTSRGFEIEDTQTQCERAILVGIDRHDPNWPLSESLAELERLANTAGAEVVGITSQRLESPNPKTFVGSGKVQEINELALANNADLVIFDDELTPSQQNNLERSIKSCKIIDRTALILDIFALHATTREGRLQVRLAQNQYLYPRLRGMWSHLASNRMGGGVGSRFGEGESQLEVDRRMVRKRIDKIKAELAKLSQDRQVQRNRRYGDGVCKAVLVGYTNAGKSSTLNALTGAGVLAQDKLFATLDSTTRSYTLPEGRKITLTDTVGFIQKLPTTLIEAFKSTLDEVIGSDLVIHICDASSQKMDSQYMAVQNVLEQIGAVSIPSITVFNKVDLLSESTLLSLKHRYLGAICVSAKDNIGFDELVFRISQACSAADSTLTVLVPYSNGSLVELAHNRCTVVSLSYLDSGVEMIIKCPTGLVSRFEPFIIKKDERCENTDEFESENASFEFEPESVHELVPVPEPELIMPIKLIDESAFEPETVPRTSNAFLLRASKDVEISPFGRAQIPTGVCIALPTNCAGLAIPIYAFSELCSLGFANSPGLIDNGYRGELKFVAYNHSSREPLHIKAGEAAGYIAVVDTLFKIDPLKHSNHKLAKEENMEAPNTNAPYTKPSNTNAPIKITQIDKDIDMPSFAHESDNGLDLRAANSFELKPHERCVIKFGIKLKVSDGYIAFVQPRSGLALREGLSIVDTPSLITADRQTDELQAVFVNLDSANAIYIEKGDRIAQLVVIKTPCIKTEITSELDSTDRGDGGFGSSGII